MFITIPSIKPNYIFIFLVLAYIAGAVGLQLPFLMPIFRPLVPLNLVVSLVLLLWYHTDWRPAFQLYVIGTILIGFFIEVAGVHTGFIFGRYAYGSVLGPHLVGVPPVIGLNWLLLSYCCGTTCDQFKVPRWVKSVLASTLMVLLDVLIEPVAVRLGFWTWFDQPVPAQNYVAWWVVSFILFNFWYRLPFRKYNRLARLMLILQFSFFAAHLVLFKAGY